MMITSSREKGFEAKQEGDINDHKKQHLKASQPSTSRQWSAFRNPRIVRVSRSFGGKDRHSKVCTVRGLRDRRIRLSVPTAIQLYDLQDKLGLNQPSKVIDWLIDVTKDDIDKLPPLQLPPGFGHQMLFSQQPNTSLSPFLDTNLMFNKVNNNGISFLDGDYLKQKFWGTEGETSLRGSNPNTSTSFRDKGKWIKISDDENQDCVVSAQKLFPLGSTHSSLMNNHLPFSSYYHFDPSNSSVSQFGANTHHGFTSQTENYFSPLPSSLGSQVFLCPTTSFFPPYEPRETNHHQWLTSSSSVNNLMKNSCQNVINQGFAQRNNTINSHKDDATDS